jgi:hypothetical protein
MRYVLLAALLAPVLVEAVVSVWPELKTVYTTRKQLKEAAHRVYSVWCGNSMASPGYQADAALVKGAGAGILPVLAELVAEKHTSDHVARGALQTAADYPLSVEFRTAARTRRDREALPYGNYWAMERWFLYFVRFGDETDLMWMEKAVRQLREEDRPRGEEHLRQLRARLATN